MMKNRIEIAYSPGDALIDIACYFGQIQNLKESFSPLGLLDLCSGIDAAVLHNKLHSFSFSPENVREDPLIDSLVSENALVLHQNLKITYKTLLDDDRLKHVLFWTSITPDKVRAHLNTNLEILAMSHSLPRIRVLYMLEDILDLPQVLNFTQTPFYLLRPDIKHEEKASELLHKSLFEQYKELTYALQSIRRQTDGIESFPMPPIALEALDNCDDLDNLGSVILDLRDKYKVIRNRFADLDEIMRSGDVSPKIKIKEQSKINSSIKALYKYDEIGEMPLLTSFGRNLNDMTELSHLLGMPDFSMIKWSKLINYIISKSTSAYWKFRLKPLFSTKDRYLNMSSNKLHAIIKKHFGRNIDKNILKYVDSYSHQVKDVHEIRYQSKEDFVKLIDQKRAYNE